MGYYGECVRPGYDPTTLNHFTELPKEKQERLLDTLTLRKWGEKKDVACLICFLASDYASYITGTMIDVSGGSWRPRYLAPLMKKRRMKVCEVLIIEVITISITYVTIHIMYCTK